MTVCWGFDLDDVLCLTPGWRTPFRQTKQLWVQVPPLFTWWPTAFVVDPDLQTFIQSLQTAGHRIAIVTARRPWCRTATLAWLARHGIAADPILFKPALDLRSTAQYKLAAVRQLGCAVFVDDDERNVAALRTLPDCIAVHWSPVRRHAVLAELAAVRQRLESRVV